MSASPNTYRFTFLPADGPVRLVLNGLTVAVSERAMVMRETRLPPAYYIPLEDVRLECAEKTEHRTYCPFKGNASYWSFTLDGKHYSNLMWSYEEPFADALQIAGYGSFYTDELDIIEHESTNQPSVISDVSAHANPLVTWLMREAPDARSGRELTAQLAETLLANAVPLWRLAIIIRTLHPQLVSFGYRWRLDSPDIEESNATYHTLETPEFLGSPVLPIFEGAGGIRRRLEGPDPILDYGILEDLRRDGATDYVAMPMTFVDGNINVMTIASDRPGGFSTTDLGNLYEILNNLGRLFEVHSTRRKTNALLDAYLGAHAGARVMDGQIQRGDGDEIKAVIWFCDLRDSTALAASMQRDEFLTVLNEYFDCMAGAVMAHGGEILRFIGDAALAVFLINDDAAEDGGAKSAGEASRTALAAALDAAGRIAKVNEARTSAGEPALGYGIALHIGEVTYGNIGTQDRLEFTVIGEAANRAARIEGMCKVVGESILFSSEFARNVADQAATIGFHTLRGIASDVELFAPKV